MAEKLKETASGSSVSGGSKVRNSTRAKRRNYGEPGADVPF